MNLYDINCILFYYVISKYVIELLFIIYILIIGDVVINYLKKYDILKDVVFFLVNNIKDIRKLI